MPIDYSKYPKDWKTRIRPQILERALNHCERCGVRNHAHILRSKRNGAIYEYYYGVDDVIGFEKPVKVVLTIAHLDHDITNNHPENLMALCQRCHLRHDKEHHQANAARTRAEKQAAGNPMLPGMEGKDGEG